MAGCLRSKADQLLRAGCGMNAPSVDACDDGRIQLDCGMVALVRDKLSEKVLAGERISAAQALDLYQWPVETLGALPNARRNLAKRARYNARGREIVPYIVVR